MVWSSERTWDGEREGRGRLWDYVIWSAYHEPLCVSLASGATWAQVFCIVVRQGREFSVKSTGLGI